jgi:hypothetical protein
MNHYTSGLSDLKKIGYKSVWLIHISPLFSTNRTTIGLQNPQDLPPQSLFASILQARHATHTFVYSSKELLLKKS